jgi:hypothetical protein
MKVVGVSHGGLTFGDVWRVVPNGMWFVGATLTRPKRAAAAGRLPWIRALLRATAGSLQPEGEPIGFNATAQKFAHEGNLPEQRLT